MITFLLTAFTLVAFAANSLLCRMALGDERIDPVSFTFIRIASGCAVLLPLALWKSPPRNSAGNSGTWFAGLALFVYAIAFSLAYRSLTTGMGALLLFGAVQVAMMGTALFQGERLARIQWLGFIAAIGGLVYLVSPGLTAPDPVGAILMAVSGIAWGAYSLAGRGSANPIAMTSGNFLRAAPLAIVAVLITLNQAHLSHVGVLLAVTSGAITSGLGYVLWYKTLPRITAYQASVVQLLVPIIAALAGVVVLSERLSGRLIGATAIILGGVLLAARKPSRA